MTKEKKETLDLDTDITYPKLKFLFESKAKENKKFNIVTNDRDSIYPLPFEESATCKGHVFISEDKIEEVVNRLLDYRLGPTLDNKNVNY